MDTRGLLLRVASNLETGHELIHVFGANAAVGTSFVPIAQGGVYQTPQSLQSLEVISTSAADAGAGLGAQVLMVEGIGPDWAYQKAEVVLTGVAATPVPGLWWRVWRTSVVRSGTYATATIASHVGTIDVRAAGAGALWARIEATDTPRSMSQIGAFSTPRGVSAFVGNFLIFTEANKDVSALGLVREHADGVVAPYAGIRVAASEFLGLQGAVAAPDTGWRGPFDSTCDIGFIAKVPSSTARVAVDFEILLVKNEHVGFTKQVLSATALT